MRVSKSLRWVIYLVGGFIAALLLILILLSIIRIPIDLSSQVEIVESVASLALGRTVNIDDRIVVSTSLRPVILIEGLRISNPKNFEEGDFLKMKTAEIRVHLLPLLRGKIKVGKFSVKGITATLLENKKGAVNWSSQPPVKGKSDAPPMPRPSYEGTQLEITSDSLVLTKLVMEDIAVSYHRPGMVESMQFKIDQCTGTMLPGKPFILSMKGNLLNEPYVTEIEIGSLQELVEKSRSQMEMITEIAKARFNLAGTLDLAKVTHSLHLKASVTGDHLDSLNGLFRLDLPPLKSYKAAAELSIRREKIELTDFAIKVGKSQLTGMMTADKSGSKPDVTVELHSPMIQLNDFDVGEWSPEKSDAKQSAVKDGRGKKSKAVRTEELLSSEVLAKLNVRVDVKAEKVISGNDELGSGVLTATLKDGRFNLDPVRLNIPGGSFFLAASLKPDIKAPEASVTATIENFDVGVPVRQARPESDMGGIINLDVDLKSSADSFGELLANGNGYFDFSGRLENLKAGIIDLWAVNVIAAVISRGKENQSKINCMVGRWAMKEGLLTPDVFLIDTTKIRICGKGQVNFNNGQIDLKMSSIPKKAEYFSLATPIEVKGNFSDFGVGVQRGGLFGTIVKFIASPVTTTFMRLSNKELPSDGNDVCAIPIGPENRSTEPPAGCK
ncbi:MAG: AsmA family protein [Desulfosarcina sp.]|jgi:uncharacterized protein involved in outer membrane biogenesis